MRKTGSGITTTSPGRDRGGEGRAGAGAPHVVCSRLSSQVKSWLMSPSESHRPPRRWRQPPPVPSYPPRQQGSFLPCALGTLSSLVLERTEMSRLSLGPGRTLQPQEPTKPVATGPGPVVGWLELGGTESSDFPLTGARAPFHNVYKGNSHDE